MQDNQQRINKLNTFLEELSKDQQIFKKQQKFNDFYMKLKGIYFIKESVYWRHSYNEIFSKITEIDDGKGSIEVLGQNIKLFYEYVEKKGDEVLKERAHKLYDHVSLDIARINYIKSIDRRLDLTGDNLEKKYDQISKNVEEKEEKINDISSKVENVYSQFVSILGIFSAVVLVFFGGITIVGDIITTLKDGNIFIGIFICLLVGVVGFNIIFMFLYIVSKLTGRPIKNERFSYYVEDDISSLKLTYPIIAYFNFFSIMAMIFDAEMFFILEAFKITRGTGIFSFLIELFQIDLYKERANCFLLLIMIIINSSFLVQYFISKVVDINIGLKIQLRYPDYYEIIQNTPNFMVLKYGECVKEFKCKFVANLYKSFKNITLVIGSKIYNCLVRCFLRYPYMAFVNVVIVICLSFLNFL